MAGLGETCSHIAALLFAAEAHTKMIKDTSCTSGPCAWLSPNMASVDYATIAEINFCTKIAKRRANMKNHTAKLHSKTKPSDSFMPLNSWCPSVFGSPT